MSANSQVDADWYEDFFSGVTLDLWRRAISPETTEEEAQFLIEQLELSENSKLLDIPSGNGRLSIPMSLLGHKVTAIDLSKEFLDECQSRAAQYEVDIECICADMKSIQWNSEFDGAFCMGNSFGYLDRNETMKFFSALSKSLRPGAKFVLESSMLAEAFLVTGGEKEWMKLGDIHMLVENQYDCRSSCVTSDYTFLRGGVEEHRIAKHYIFTTGELCHMLESVQMEVLDLFETTECEPFKLGAERLFLVAQKAS